MAHLIDKDALVAEIERLKEENKPTSKPICDYIKGGIYGFDLAIEKTLSILDTLEVKEVDLEKKEEKLNKAIKLADAMYDAAQRLTTDASRLHKAMQDWWNFKNINL